MNGLKKIVLSVLSLLVLFPVIYTVCNAFMGTDEILTYYQGIWGDGQIRFHLIPDKISFDSFEYILHGTSEYLVRFWKSICITGLIAVGQVFVSILAGYGFSKFRFPGSRVLFIIVVILMMMPYQVTLVSNYIMLDKIGIIGKYSAVILPGIFTSFGVFLMKQSIDTIPDEYFEAAKIDGAGVVVTIRSILLPISKGAVASLFLLNFIDNWNMVEQPLIFLNDESKYPLSIYLSQSITESSGYIFACGVLAMIPIFLLYFNFGKWLEKGISTTALK